jgi:glycosyltransferase involved in cell wall biosynthesis
MNINKKVLYISYDGMTDPLGQSQVIPYLQQLTKNGYQFTILSVEKKKRLEENGQRIKQLLLGMGIKWETLIITTKPPLLSKIYDQLKINKTAARLYQKNKFDLVHCRSYVAAEAGLKLFHRFKVPFLFDMRGFWVDERVDSGHWNKGNPLYRFLYKLYKGKEKKYFSESAHIISLTQKGKDELINAYNVSVDKISVIPCCADLEHFDYKKINDEEKKKAKEKLRIAPDHKVLSYLGSLGGWYMTDEMLDFFAVIKTKIPQTIFLFITHDNKETILKKAAEKGIAAEDIRIQPATRNEVPLYLSVSNWSIFFIKDVYSKKASSPTKQGEIMGMGIPVICNDIGDTGKIVATTTSGIIVNEFNKEAYSKAADKLTMMNTELSSCIREGAFQYYDLHSGVRNYLEVYKKVLA